MQKRSTRNTKEDVEIARMPGLEGLHVWWLVSNEETGSSRVVVQVSEFPPGKRLGLHRHPNAEEVTYVLRGTGVHLYEGGEVVQEQGEAVFIGQDEWHGFRNDTDEPVVIMGIYGGVGSAEEAGIEEYPDDAGPIPPGN